MWCCIQMNKELPVSKSKSVRNIYPAKLESGGNGFKSCFVQISTKHSSQPLTEYQFCFFSYFPRVTGNSFVKTLRKKKKVLVQIFLLYFFCFLELDRQHSITVPFILAAASVKSWSILNPKTLPGQFSTKSIYFTSYMGGKHFFLNTCVVIIFAL